MPIQTLLKSKGKPDKWKPWQDLIWPLPTGLNLSGGWGHLEAETGENGLMQRHI